MRKTIAVKAKTCEVLEAKFMDMNLVPCGKKARVRLRRKDDGALAWMCGRHAREFSGECKLVERA